MPDIFTQRKRAAVMAAIRSHGNKATELRLIQIFRTHGIINLRRKLPPSFRRAMAGKSAGQAGRRVQPESVA